MNRREFLNKLLPFGLITTMPLSVASIATFNNRLTYGYVSVNDPVSSYCKVYLNGEDVSGQCYEADDREGFVGLYNAHKEGNLIHLDYPVVKRRVYGNVRIVVEKQ